MNSSGHGIRLNRALAALACASMLAAACSAGPRTGGSAAGAGAAQAPAASQPAPAAASAFAAAMTMSLDELHEKAKTEGGSFACYCTMAQINAEKIFPAFERRFPGIKVEHVDATADKLVARLIAESRGGKTFADVFSATVEYVLQTERQGLLLTAVPPEAEAYPENLRGKTWVAADLQFIVVAWNTNLVRPDEIPTSFEDFADPRWKGRLIAEPRDVELLMALTQKLGSQERATEVIRRIAANDVEFHKGHSELAELLAAGQAAVCITCYAHHYPPRIRRGVPVDFMTTEGIGLIVANSVMKDAPHPYTAMLWERWATSEAGQQAYSDGGRHPAHPNVTTTERMRPDKLYPIGAEESARMNQFERTWKETFDIR